MEKEIAKSLDENEIMQLVDNKAKVVLYSDLYKYSNLRDLLAPHGAVFLLYQQRPEYGHWTVLFKQSKDTIEFFDPYGVFPDDELQWTDSGMRNELNMNYPYLTALLYRAPVNYTITYNDHKFQTQGKGINTCGRWCAMRLALRDQSLKEFIKLNENDSQKDKTITILTSEI